MTTFWTVLWITVLGGEADGLTYPILYLSEDDCNAARNIVSDTLHYDHKLDCVVSDIISAPRRPVARPNDW